MSGRRGRLEPLVAILVLALGWSGAVGLGRSQAYRYKKDLRMPVSGEGFQQPLSVHVDLHTGEIFVLDRRTHQIAIFDRRGLFRFRISGGKSFSVPQDVGVDPEGYLYLLCQRHGKQAILHLDFDGRELGEIPILGIPEVFGEIAVTSLALSPSGDRLFLVDSGNGRLWWTSREGKVLGSADLLADVDEKDAPGQVIGHVDVYGDTVLVSMPMLGVVRQFGLDGTSRGYVGVKGTLPCQNGFPVAAALDREGKVVILDRQRMAVTLWDPGKNRCLSEYAAYGAGPGELYFPADLALGGQGRVVVGQGYHGKVQWLEGWTGAAGAPGQPPRPPATPPSKGALELEEKIEENSLPQ